MVMTATGCFVAGLTTAWSFGFSGSTHRAVDVELAFVEHRCLRLPTLFFIEPSPDELAITFAIETRKMAAMHQPHRQRHETFHRGDVVRYVGVVGVLDQRTVVDDVT